MTEDQDASLPLSERVTSRCGVLEKVGHARLALAAIAEAEEDHAAAIGHVQVASRVFCRRANTSCKIAPVVNDDGGGVGGSGVVGVGMDADDDAEGESSVRAQHARQFPPHLPRNSLSDPFSTAASAGSGGSGSGSGSAGGSVGSGRSFAAYATTLAMQASLIGTGVKRDGAGEGEGEIDPVTGEMREGGGEEEQVARAAEPLLRIWAGKHLGGLQFAAAHVSVKPFIVGVCRLARSRTT